MFFQRLLILSHKIDEWINTCICLNQILSAGAVRIVYTITEAKAHFSALIEQVLLGEEIIIKKAGVPVAVLKPYVAQSQQRVPGALAGKIKINPDFDDLPKEIAQAFGMDS